MLKNINEYCYKTILVSTVSLLGLVSPCFASQLQHWLLVTCFFWVSISSSVKWGYFSSMCVYGLKEDGMRRKSLWPKDPMFKIQPYYLLKYWNVTILIGKKSLPKPLFCPPWHPGHPYSSLRHSSSKTPHEQVFQDPAPALQLYSILMPGWIWLYILTTIPSSL